MRAFDSPAKRMAMPASVKFPSRPVARPCDRWPAAVTSAHHRVLIEATVRVARSLRMGTVAEGIETAGQAAVVRELGCDKGQGYFYSKPLSAADLALWLSARTASAAHAPASLLTA